MKKSLLLLSASGLLCGLNAQAQTNFPEHSMENWRNITTSNPSLTFTAPNNWFGSDSLINAVAPMAAMGGMNVTPAQMIFQSSDAHSGSSAAEIKSANLGDVGVLGGALTNANIGLDIGVAMTGDIANAITFSGGTSVSAPIVKVNAWVKTGSANVEKSVVMARAVAGAQTIAEGQIEIDPATTSAYTQVEIPLAMVAQGTPDHLIVVFMSSGISADTTVSATDGNTLFVDDVTYTTGTVGITNPIFQPNNINVYPNPASGSVQFELNKNEKPENYALTITDISGKVIAQNAFNNHVLKMDISNYSSGMYLFTLTNTISQTTETGKFLVK